MAKPVKLSVHKNTLVRRHARGLKQTAKDCLDRHCAEFGPDLRGFVLITWDREGSTIADWSGGRTISPCPVDEFAKNAVQRQLTSMKIKEKLFPEQGD